MKTSLFVLLLAGSLSGAKTDESANSPGSKPTYQSDSLAVLTQMSASLAELKEKMKCLQEKNEDQATALTSLKAQSTANQKQLEDQATALTSLKNQSTANQKQLEALKHDKQIKQVAFSASLTATRAVRFGTYSHYVPLIYKHVITNIGNHYNPITGVFTAPVRGVYHFQFYVTGQGSQPSAAVLFKNGQKIFTAYELQPSGYASSANGASLLLEVGEVVYLSLYPNSMIFDDIVHHNTFSGYLLFSM